MSSTETALAAVAKDNPESILVVDGSTLVTDMVSEWLRMEGEAPITAESGLNAWAKIELFKPDIVICNVDLPDISGFDLCKRVKDDAAYGETLVLLFGAADSQHTRLRAEEIGADDYIRVDAERYQFISRVRSLRRVRRLSSQLRQKYAELEEKTRLMNIQIEMGMQLQRALIPEIDMRFKDCRLMSRYYPAWGVGGDFYNVLSLSENSFGVVMGDISGHGIAAAFLTAMVGLMVRNLTHRYYNPDQLLFYLNNELFAMFEHTEQAPYASIFYAVVNTRDHYIHYANAGQCLPLYVDSAAGLVTELTAEGFPVGLMKDSRYQQHSVAYAPSDLLLFHTDGLQDTFYKDKPDAFTGRMAEILAGIRPVNSLKEIIDVVVDNFYQTDPSETRRMAMDDVSLLVCRLQ